MEEGVRNRIRYYRTDRKKPALKNDLSTPDDTVSCSGVEIGTTRADLRVYTLDVKRGGKEQTCSPRDSENLAPHADLRWKRKGDNDFSPYESRFRHPSYGFLG